MSRDQPVEKHWLKYHIQLKRKIICCKRGHNENSVINLSPKGLSCTQFNLVLANKFGRSRVRRRYKQV